MVRPPGQGGQLPGRRLHGLRLAPRPCLARLPLVPAEDWARDAQRRQACHVPLEIRYQTRQEQCLAMLDAWGKQVPHGWVTGDDELGRHTQFRHELRERGERYVLGVPCNTTIRDLEAPLPTY
jgi:SRSO17 transposase